MWAGNIFLPLLSIQINLILALITEEFSISINEIIDGDSDIFSQAAYVQTGSELYYFKDISYQDSPILPISADYKKELRFETKLPTLFLYKNIFVYVLVLIWIQNIMSRETSNYFVKKQLILEKRHLEYYIKQKTN
jgi:hypothetical protein